MNELSDKGAAFIRGHEGFVARWYRDPVGVWTIGTGFTWRSAAFREWWAKNKPGQAKYTGRMTRSESDDALRYLCKHEYGKAVNKFLSKKVPQHVFDGMTSPVYNLGPGSLKWTWAKFAKAGDYSAAAARLRKTGTTASGKRLPGLVRRRKEEALLLEKGIYTGVDAGSHQEPVDAMADGVLVRGEAGKAVAKLIKDLTKLGYYDGVQDDIFGLGTEAAVLDFQNAKGLKADGYAGPETLAAIEVALVRLAKEEMPDEAKDVIEDAAKDTSKSTTIWSTIGGWLVSAVTALSSLEWQVAIAVILAASIFAFWIIRERRRKSKKGKAAIDVLNGIFGSAD